MSRGVGELAAVSGLPDAVVVAAALLTQLGDVWFFFGLVGLLYWYGDALPGPVALDRRHAAYVIALGLGANALVTTLKQWFAGARPPGAGTAPTVEAMPTLLEPLFASAATGTGFGFPSGHALATAVVYGGLALVVGTRRAYASAAAIAVVVALTRVLLGVHYLVDVVAGVAVGAGFLAAVHLASDRGDAPGRAFALAGIVAPIGLALGGSGFETMTALGAALGAGVAWILADDALTAEPATRRGGTVSLAIGAGLGLLFGAITALEPAAHRSFMAMAVVLAGVVVAPLAGEAVGRPS